MRAFLVRHGSPQGWLTFGVTLTIPGPLMTVPESQALFDRFRKRADYEGWAFVWRIEVQKRGALHWHLLLIAPPITDERLEGEIFPELVAIRCRKHWLEALNGCGGCECDKPGGWYIPEIKRHASAMTRDSIPGAEYRAAVVEWDQGQVAHGWLRYLQDHATKHKQEQVAENIGRHWGIVGKSRFAELAADRVAMSKGAYNRFRRAYEKLVGGHVKCDKALFGYRRRRRVARGRCGSHYSFANPETIRRMISWATSTDEAEK